MSTILADPQRAFSSRASIPSKDELLGRARTLVSALRQLARTTEINHRVSVQTTQLMRDADLFRLMQPKRFGGFEYGFSELIDITSIIGTACGSTAWCYGLATVHNWLVSKFPLQAQEDIWNENPDALICGSYAPVAQAVAVRDGYTISGRWEFASNCQNSEWAMLGVIFPPSDGAQRPEAGFLLVPASQYEIDPNWDTVGLSGTGSHTVVVKANLFVPAHRKLTFEQASSNVPPGVSAHQNPLYRVPFLSAGPVALVSSAIGMVQGSLDDFLEMNRTRQTRGAVAGAGSSLSQFPHVQTRVTEAAAAIDVARMLLHRDTAEALAEVELGQPVCMDTRMRNRRDQAYCVRLLTQAATTLFDAVGGAGLSLESSIQRHWRDTYAVSRHVSFNWDAVSAMYGQYRFGLEPKGQY